MKKYLLFYFLIILFAGACSTGSKNKEATSEIDSKKELSFELKKIVNNAKEWWAIAVGDITYDGLADIVWIHNNGYGGFLGYSTAQKDSGIWKQTIISEHPPGGGEFASGDLELGDVDGDGDIDILAVKHTGEWDNSGEPAELYWYENPNWVPHFIGGVPSAIKDLSLADFDKNGKLDLVALTYDAHNISIHKQNDDGTFTLVQSINAKNLHEGMDIGDIDGDGDLDIAANGYAIYNPGKDISEEWAMEIIDPKWLNQSGDWSQNATKNFCSDINNDGKDEVFISHSERNGYSVSWYEKTESGWIENIICDSLSSCHTLQVFDMDLDGDLDVVAGTNAGRAVKIGKTEFPLKVFLNDGTNKSWTKMQVLNSGIYNGRVIDFEGDGDYDIFRMADHMAKDVYLIENKIR